MLIIESALAHVNEQLKAKVRARRSIEHLALILGNDITAKLQRNLRGDARRFITHEHHLLWPSLV